MIDRLARLARLRAIEGRETARVARDLAQDAARAQTLARRVADLRRQLDGPAPSETSSGADLVMRSARRATLAQASSVAAAQCARAQRQSADADTVNRLARARIDAVEQRRVSQAREQDRALERRACENASPVARTLLSLGREATGA